MTVTSRLLRRNADGLEQLVETHYGLGRHTWLLTANYVPYMQSFYASIILFNVGTCVVKMSVLFQYRRIFQVPLMRMLTLGGLLFQGVWAVTLSVLLPLVCTPVSSFWNPNVPGKCLNQLASKSSGRVDSQKVMMINIWACSLVCRGGGESHLGLCRFLDASPRHQELASSSQAEDHAYGRVLSGLLVRHNPSSMLSRCDS